MAFLSLWLKKIILLVLLATFVDLLLPNGTMQKYVKMVMGLLLLMTFLAPVFLIFKGNSNIDLLLTELMRGNETQQIVSKEQILSEAEKLKQSQQQLAIEQAKQEIAKRIQHDIEQKFNYIVETINVGIKQSESEYVDLQLVHLEVVLKVHSTNGDQKKVTNGGEREAQKIEPVKISPVTRVMSQDIPSDSLKAMRLTDIEDWLEQQWSLHQDQAVVVLLEEGGPNDS